MEAKTRKLKQPRVLPQKNPLSGITFEELFPHSNLYLCGEPIKQVFENQFFESLNHYVLCGFCYGQSALAMLMLKGDPTARIVQGRARGTREHGVFRHCWVEIERGNNWYVIDFAWFPWTVQPIPLEWYYDPLVVKAEPLWACESREFWQMHLSNIIFDKCSRPQTSWVLPQIIWGFMPPTNHVTYAVGCGFNIPDIEYLRDPAVGRIMIPQAFRFNDVFLDKHVIKELMQPGLTEVSPRTKYQAERQYWRLCKKVHAQEIYADKILAAH